ncbi:serine hydrolase domain-containing protein [Kitasatospora sp. NPDC088346]|uniref:serine hydrolase domain-containing protein n=1 Tax=Kitasatospora sp. NPDC088346 TaxID=3364073 RepID=UPI0038190E71
MTDLGDLARRTADRLVERHVGVVVAAVAGDGVAIRGAGSPGGGRSGPPGADTVFEIGSVTKVFTSLALARLVVAGAAELDEPLVRLLPKGTAVPSRGGTEITLRHLATHTSGLPRLPKGMLLRALLRPSTPDPYAGCTADVLLRGLPTTRQAATPGHRFRYSNLGAGLLGLALAHRAGTDYQSLIDREICTPLGLGDTGVTRPALLTQGHTARRRPTPAWDLAGLAGAGGLRSTAADLVTFLRAQLGSGPDGLAEAIALTRSTEHLRNPFAWIHLGWLGQRLHPRQGGHLQLWHNGGTGGFASFTGFDPERRVAVVVLSNTRRSVDAAGFELLRTLQNTAAAA